MFADSDVYMHICFGSIIIYSQDDTTLFKTDQVISFPCIIIDILGSLYYARL